MPRAHAPSTIDPAKRRDGLSVESVLEAGVELRFGGMLASSAFQPIYASRDRAVVAFEALLRARDESSRPLSPSEAFVRASRDGSESSFERLCRMLHLRNASQLPASALVFVNIDPTRLCDVALERSLGELGIPRGRVVLEVLETAVDDDARLVDAVTRLRALGHRIAIDDFGTCASNADRVLLLQPDFVKLDRSLVVEAALSSGMSVVLRELVTFLHALGAEVIVEGIETEAEEAAAATSGADYLQGFRLGRPLPVASFRAASAARDRESRVNAQRIASNTTTGSSRSVVCW